MSRRRYHLDYDDDGHDRDGWDAGTDRLKAILVTKLIGIATPWLVAFALLPAVGSLARWQWAGDRWVALFLALAATLIGGATWAVSHARGLLGRAHVTVTAAGPPAWLALVTLAGLGRVTWNLLIIAGGTVALLWNIRKLVRAAYGERDPWSEVIAPAARIDGTRLEITSRGAEHAKGILEAPRGKLTASDLTQASERIAAAMRLPAAGVRITPDPDDAGRAHVAFTRRDLLKAERAWALPEVLGRSVGDAPVLLGRYEDGTPALFDPLSGADRDITHLLIVGTTGSGKSLGALVIIADLLTRSDVVVVGADTVKGRQTVGEFEHALAWFAGTRRDARELLAAVKRAIPLRAGWLGDRGHRKWAPGCGLPLLACWLEEAADYVPDSRTFSDLAMQARSAGVMLIVSVQRATYDNIPTTARSMLGSVLCFGVATDADAGYALGDLVDQGARPDLWRDRRKGYAYLAAAGIDPSRHTMPLRTDHIQQAQMLEVAAWDGRAGLGEVTAAAFGPAFAAAWSGRHPGTAGTVPPATVPPAATEDHGQSRRERIEAIPDELPRPDTVVDLPAPKRAPTAEARARLRARIAEIAAEGDETFEVRRLHKLVARVGRSEAWLYAELHTLIGEGRLERVDQGVYRALVLAGAGAGAQGP